jgi:NADPH:quinone reductase-like Zn-dependent oxidoreductase
MGPSFKGFPKGMRVMALANRTYAEYTVAKADVLAAIPDALNFEEAGALPLVATTGAQRAAFWAQCSDNQREPTNTTSKSRRSWRSRTLHDFINWLKTLLAMNSRFRLLAR